MTDAILGAYATIGKKNFYMNPFKRKGDQPAQIVILDTCALIDGRIIEIAKAGFVPPNIVVPQFVIAELQYLADHGDSHKRERARYGLDVIRELQDIRRAVVTIAREKFPSIKEVDDKLVALAKQYTGMLYTTDFNLNKVAQIEGVVVLNVNELAQALRPNLLPGEKVTIKVTQVGQDKTQGVGYLSDGTMVVVEQASRYVGQTVQAVCTRILQTQAGKMMFATLANKPAQPTAQPQQNHQRQLLSVPAGHAQPQKQPQQERQEAKQQPRPARENREHRDNNQESKQHNSQQPAHDSHQAANQQQKQPRQRHNGGQGNNNRRPQKRRMSPEESLLATLEQTEQR